MGSQQRRCMTHITHPPVHQVGLGGAGSTLRIFPGGCMNHNMHLLGRCAEGIVQAETVKSRNRWSGVVELKDGFESIPLLALSAVTEAEELVVFLRSSVHK